MISWVTIFCICSYDLYSWRWQLKCSYDLYSPHVSMISLDRTVSSSVRLSPTGWALEVWWRASNTSGRASNRTKGEFRTPIQPRQSWSTEQRIHKSCQIRFSTLFTSKNTRKQQAIYSPRWLRLEQLHVQPIYHCAQSLDVGDMLPESNY